jgi:hypothetical protein
MPENNGIPDGVNEETLHAVLNMLSGPPSPSHVVARHLETAARIGRNLKLIGGTVSGFMLAVSTALVYVIGILHRVDDNTDFVKDAKPRIATWERTAAEWNTFSQGAECDLSHLREMQWQKNLGLTNADLKSGRNNTPPPYAGPTPSPKN